MKQIKIITQERHNDWIAYPEDNNAIWEAGATEKEALVKLFNSLDKCDDYRNTFFFS